MGMGSLQIQNPRHYNSNCNSRRFSVTASSIRNNLRDQTGSFRYNIIQEEIDPTTYSFNTALRALQARSPDGYALNSKWDEAEKYICNPLSGEFPMECLSSSAKTQLSATSFRRKTISSSPLVCPTHSRRMQVQDDYYVEEQVPFSSINQAKDKKKLEGSTRDVGTQSTLLDSCSSDRPCTAPTPKAMQKTLVNQTGEADDGDSNHSSNSKTLTFDKRVDAKENNREGSEGTRKEICGKEAAKPKRERRQLRGASCLSLNLKLLLIGKTQQEKQNPRKGCMHVRINGC